MGKGKLSTKMVRLWNTNGLKAMQSPKSVIETVKDQGNHQGRIHKTHLQSITMNMFLLPMISQRQPQSIEYPNQNTRILANQWNYIRCDNFNNLNQYTLIHINISINLWETSTYAYLNSARLQQIPGLRAAVHPTDFHHHNGSFLGLLAC